MFETHRAFLSTKQATLKPESVETGFSIKKAYYILNTVKQNKNIYIYSLRQSSRAQSADSRTPLTLLIISVTSLYCFINATVHFYMCHFTPLICFKRLVDLQQRKVLGS